VETPNNLKYIQSVPKKRVRKRDNYEISYCI
jgi:hypothetical protein